MAVKEVIMFTLNSIIMAVGVLLIACGVFIITTEVQQFITGIPSLFHTIGIAFFALGSALCLLAITGCCGAVIKEGVILKPYIVITSLALIIEVAAFVAFYVLQTRRQEEAIIDLKNSIQMYDESFDIEGIWDVTQNSSKCCGVDGPSDWILSDNFDENSRSTVPLSCCEEDVNVCEVQSAYAKGCSSLLGHFTELQLTLSAVIAGILFSSQILSVIVAWRLAVKPRPAKWDKPL